MSVIDEKSISFIISTNLALVGYNNWSINGGVVIDGGAKCKVSNNGKITGSSSNANILKASKYIRIDLQLDTSILGTNGNIAFDYNDKFAVELALDYKANDSQEATRDNVRIALNKYNTKNNKLTYIFETANRDYSKIKASIINKTGQEVTVQQLKIYRSKDVTEQSLLDAGGITGFEASYIELRTSNPENATPGRIWFRVDL